MRSNRTHDKKRASSHGLFFIVIGMILLVVAMLFIYLAIRSWEEKRSQESVSDQAGSNSISGPEIVYNGTTYRLRDGVETTLLIGLDAYEQDIETDPEVHRNELQADFLTLLIYDKEKGTSRILMINRDTMAKLPVIDIFGREGGTLTGQLALAHTYGSGELDSVRNTAKAVSKFLYNVPIDHYISITMDAVGMINDDLGGVPVVIEDDFSAVDPSLVSGEEVVLMGEHALTFVRARGSMDDPTNLNRMKRQEQYLNAFYKVLSEKMKTDPDLVSRVMFDISPYMQADCSVTVLSDILNQALGADVGEIETVQGEAREGKVFMEFYPDEEALTQQVVDLWFEPIS